MTKVANDLAIDAVKPKSLTFMSTGDQIASLVSSQELYMFVPQRTNQPSSRRLFLTKTAQEKVFATTSPIGLIYGAPIIGKIRAVLTSWVLGCRIYGSSKNCLLKDLSPPPPEVWEIRIFEPKPQFRAIGRFVGKDTFIVSDICNRDVLGGFGSRAWANAMEECDQSLSRMGFDANFFVGHEINDYISKNCDQFAIKQPRRTTRASSRSSRVRKKNTR